MNEQQLQELADVLSMLDSIEWILQDRRDESNLLEVVAEIKTKLVTIHGLDNSRFV